MTDPTIEILFKFQYLKRLELNAIHLSQEKIAVLHAVSFEEIILNSCSVERFFTIKLAKLIQSKGPLLRKLHIGFHGCSPFMKETVMYLLYNIEHFNAIKLRISNGYYPCI